MTDPDVIEHHAHLPETQIQGQDPYFSRPDPHLRSGLQPISDSDSEARRICIPPEEQIFEGHKWQHPVTGQLFVRPKTWTLMARCPRTEPAQSGV
jgi:hypothetical protein